MFTLEILHTDITQMDVDRIVCPIHEDLTPAYDAGNAIFSAAGYDQLQKVLCDRGPGGAGFAVPSFHLKAQSLFLLKVRGDSEKHLAHWSEGALEVSVKGLSIETAAIPVLIDTEDVEQSERQWRMVLRLILRLRKLSGMVGKSIFLVTQSEMLCKTGRRVWQQMLQEEKDKALLNQAREFERQIAEKNCQITAQEHKIAELEALLAEQNRIRAELSPEDAQLLEQLDRKKLAESIELLCRVRKIPWEPMKETESGVWQLGYPRYPEGIFDIFQLMESDLRYRRNMDKIRMQKLRISELSLSQIRTYLTYLQRGERFCDGTIAEAVDDGRLLKLLLRIHDLINPYPW